jgi:hypothetical protein
VIVLGKNMAAIYKSVCVGASSEWKSLTWSGRVSSGSRMSEISSSLSLSLSLLLDVFEDVWMNDPEQNDRDNDLHLGSGSWVVGEGSSVTEANVQVLEKCCWRSNSGNCITKRRERTVKKVKSEREQECKKAKETNLHG